MPNRSDRSRRSTARIARALAPLAGAGVLFGASPATAAPMGPALGRTLASALEPHWPAAASPDAARLPVDEPRLAADGAEHASLGDLGVRSLQSLGGGLRSLLAPGRRVEARLETGADGRARYRVPLDQGAEAELTLDARAQDLADRVLAGHRAPYAAAVMLDVADGRVLAMAGRSEDDPTETAADLCLTPWAPAASVFKLVTAAALVESGIGPESRVCYHDGVHSVEASNLRRDPRHDTECNTLAFGVAKSQNAIVARLASDHLEPSLLERTARALGFGAPIAADVPVAASHLDVPSDPLAFARTAAGFFHSTLSPLHGAWLAATIARGGVAPALRLLDRVVDKAGAVVAALAPAAPGARVLDERVARAVGQMMVGTTRYGTAKHAFHDRRGRAYLPGVDVAGKTGSLNRKDGPFLAYSWFVGYAPADNPQVAVAVLLGNRDVWQVHASHVARELLDGWFHGGSGGRTMLAAR